MNGLAHMLKLDIKTISGDALSTTLGLLDIPTLSLRDKAQPYEI